jgi:hypothetical protein
MRPARYISNNSPKNFDKRGYAHIREANPLFNITKGHPQAIVGYIKTENGIYALFSGQSSKFNRFDPNIPVNFTSADNNVVYLNNSSKEASMVLLAVAVHNFHKTISASDFHMDNKQADKLDKKFSEYLNKNINIFIYDE